jgi:ankyrin repeat protein
MTCLSAQPNSLSLAAPLHLSMQLSPSIPLSKPSPAQLLQFQDSIRNGDLPVLETLLTEGASANHPLPNGEMPLHYAVRNNQEKSVALLLKNGADSEFKDFQHLSAIDHAVLMHNDALLATILSFKVGNELQQVKEQIKCKGSAAHVSQLQSTIQKKFTVDNASLVLCPENQTAYRGHLQGLTHLINQNVNRADAKGWTPLHYAVLGNQCEAVQFLLQKGANARILDKDKDSLLHFAAVQGSQQLLKQLIDAGCDPNVRNSSGATPLHYAAAKEDLATVEFLIKNGADPHILDNRKISALALIGTSAYQRDPLALPRTHLLMFTTSCLFWVSYAAVTRNWISSQEGSMINTFVFLGASFASNFSEFALLFTNLDKNWKKALALAGFFGLSFIPPLNIGFQAWTTYHIARTTLNGLKNCWRNLGYRNWEIARNVLVHSVNTAHSLYYQCTLVYVLSIHTFYWYKMAYAEDEEALLLAIEEYLRFVQQRYKIEQEVLSADKCPYVDPSTLTKLTALERLNHPELKPNCPEHALMMLSPNFTMDQLKAEGVGLYKNTYRQLMLKEVHPDKAIGDKEAIERAAANLNVAKTTLGKWVERNR